MAYFWQFSFCIHKNIQVFIWNRLQSQFSTDHWGEIKKKPVTLIISKLRLARRSALSTFLRARGGGGGTQMLFGRGCAAEASKPVPIFKGHFGGKGVPIIRDF